MSEESLRSPATMNEIFILRQWLRTLPRSRLSASRSTDARGERSSASELETKWISFPRAQLAREARMQVNNPIKAGRLEALTRKPKPMARDCCFKKSFGFVRKMRTVRGSSALPRWGLMQGDWWRFCRIFFFPILTAAFSAGTYSCCHRGAGAPAAILCPATRRRREIGGEQRLVS